MRRRRHLLAAAARTTSLVSALGTLKAASWRPFSGQAGLVSGELVDVVCQSKWRPRLANFRMLR
jgi:hypothetical protein